MSLWVDILSLLLAISGGAFTLIGTIGLFRMPDFPSRTHAAGLIDVFGILQVLAAVMLQYGLSITAMKIALTMVLLGVTSPVALHAIFRAYRQTHP